MTYTQVWYIIGIVSSSPTDIHSEKIGLTMPSQIPTDLHTSVIPIVFKVLYLKWVPENLYTFTIWSTIEKVYIFSGTHFSSKNLVAISDSFLGLARTLKIRAWDCKELAENALALIKY